MHLRKSFHKLHLTIFNYSKHQLGLNILRNYLSNKDFINIKQVFNIWKFKLIKVKATKKILRITKIYKLRISIKKWQININKINIITNR